MGVPKEAIGHVVGTECEMEGVEADWVKTGVEKRSSGGRGDAAAVTWCWAARYR